MEVLRAPAFSLHVTAEESDMKSREDSNLVGVSPVG
jgi:hypothetical protein